MAARAGRLFAAQQAAKARQEALPPAARIALGPLPPSRARIWANTLFSQGLLLGLAWLVAGSFDYPVLHRLGDFDPPWAAGPRWPPAPWG